MARRTANADVTEAELAVLQLLWDRTAATVRELADVLYPGGDATHYGTVQKLLQRLQTKGCVRRLPRTTPIAFAAKMSRQELLDRRLRRVVADLCAGSLTPLLTHVTRRDELTAQEREQLLEFVRNLERRRRREDP